MRLRQIEQTIRLYLPESLNIESPVALPNGQQGIRIHGLSKWRAAIRQLDSLPPLQVYTAQLLKNPILTTTYEDTLLGPTQDLQPIVTVLSQLNRFAGELLRMIQLVIPEQDEERTLVIEIPPPDSLRSLVDVVSGIERFFNLLARAEEGEAEKRIGEPVVQAFDSGSYYIEVLLTASVGLTVVGGVFRVVFDILKKYHEYRLVVAHAETADLAVADLKSLQENNEKIRRALTQGMVNKLRESHFPKAQQESFNALYAAVQEGTKLIQAGVKMLPPINADKDVVKSFPRSEELQLLMAPEVQKMLAPNTEPVPATKDSVSKRTT